MEILVEGQAPVTADIIFVHGLRGDRLNTWTKGQTLWPKDLLSQRAKHARIMSWGYDAQVMNFFEKSGQCSIYDHAQQLLQDISIERSSPEEVSTKSDGKKARPIVFVAHSLGGIVVKDALCISYMESREAVVRKPRIAAIKKETIGVVFMGTPHRGSSKAKWASIATNFAVIVLKDHNDRVVDALNRGAETLERIQTGFSKILITLPVWSFFENYQYPKIGKIVDDDSASLGFPQEEKGWIDANHSDMVKFDSLQDPGFKRVAAAITNLIEDGLEARQNEAARSTARPKPKGSRYISMKEHRFEDPKFLSFGCDEFIERVKTYPGRWWEGHHRGKTGLFLKDSVELAPDVESATQEEFPESWKIPKPVTRQNTVVGTWKKDAEKISAAPSRVHGHIGNRALAQPSPTNTEEQSSTNSMKGSGTEEHEALLVSAEEGHEDAILRLIKKGVDVNAKGGVHGNALATASYHNRKNIVKILLNNGALVNQPGGPDGFALHSAAGQGHADVVKVLLGRGADVQIQGGQWRFALTAAAFNGSVRVMKMLLNEGAELNALDYENESALHGAVFGGHVESVTFLLEQGIRTDVCGANGTPLDMAKQTGQSSIAKLLSSESDPEPEATPPPSSATVAKSPLKVETEPDSELDPASVEAISQYLVAMLVVSAQLGNAEDVQLLLEAGVSPNETWGAHGYPLHAACANGHIAVAQVLLENGARIDAFGGIMGYALHAACLSGSVLLVLLLVAWGANIHACITTFGYPLHVASSNGDLKTMALLLDLGADINAIGGDFGTAVIAAASSGLEPSVLLVQRGANIFIKAPNGLGVVDMARAYRHPETKDFFKTCGAKSSGFFSIAGFVSRMSSLSLKMEAVNAANAAAEAEKVLEQPAAAA